MMTNGRLTLQILYSATGLSLLTLMASPVLAQSQNVITKNGVASYQLPLDEKNRPRLEDMEDAVPMPMPMVDYMPEDAERDSGIQGDLGAPGSEPGQRGNGKQSPVELPITNSADDEGVWLDSMDSGIAPQEYGTANHPYTTARVDTSGNNVSRTYPYRAAGKLYFKNGTSSYVCSGALIKRGVVATAAHCVAAFGKKRFYTSFQFVPAKYNTVAPYGVWAGERAFVLASYYNGTDLCAPSSPGVVCKNDVAVIRLQPQSGVYAGTRTGWFGYGWNGYGFTSGKRTLINQLGYPASHDSGNIMQRTDSQGFVAGSSLVGNTVWGSRQTGGSSGGPEVVNLGIRGTLSSAAPVGSANGVNRIIGVTSWGYTNSAVKQQGASPFLSTNIVTLVNAACANSNPACLSR